MCNSQAYKSQIGYRRLLNLIRKPEKMICFEIERVSKTLKIGYARLIELIENQIKKDLL
jgi:hypothetical protein